MTAEEAVALTARRANRKLAFLKAAAKKTVPPTMAVVQIEAQALRDAAKTIARGEVIKVQIARCQRKLALLNDELNLIYPPLYDERFGNNIGTIASGIAGKR